MAQEFRITQGELQQRASEMRTVATQIEEQLGDAGRRVDQLLGDWIGSASEAFKELWGEWQTAARSCHTDLQTIADAMEKMGTGFEEHEQEAARSLRSMRSS